LNLISKIWQDMGLLNKFQ